MNRNYRKHQFTHMKFFIHCVSLLFLLAFSAEAQSQAALNSALAKDLETFKRVTLRNDFDSTLQFMPPKMFDIIPRDSLRDLMTKSVDNEYMRIEMTGFQYTGKQKIKKAGIYQWAFVTYDGSMKLYLKGEDSFNQLMIPMMKSTFGEKNVVQSGDKTLDVSMPDKQIIAYKDPASPIWSFLEDKRGQEDAMQQYIYENVVPKEVQKAVGKKKVKKK